MRLPERIKHARKYAVAMEITDPDEADANIEVRFEHQVRIGGCSQEEAERIERTIIAYWEDAVPIEGA